MPSPWESEEIAAARLALGRQLAALRQAAGYTQAGLAAEAGWSRSTLGNVETGRQSAPRLFWKRCADILAAPELVLACGQIGEMISAERTAAARRAEADREARVRKRRDTAGPVALSLTGYADAAVPAQPQWVATGGEAMLKAVELWQHDLADRGTRPGNADTAAAMILCWLTALPDHPLTRATGAWAISPGDLQRLRSVRSRLKDIDNAHGGGVAFPMMAAYLRTEAIPLLYGQYDEETGRALAESLAQLELDAGWSAYDAGDHRLARCYLLHALRLAHTAADRMLGGRIVCALSHQALHTGQPVLSVRLARAARAGAGPAATPRGTAMMAAMEAMAHANVADPGRCHQAVEDAQRALASAAPGDGDPEWLDFDEGGLLGHQAWATRDLAAAGLANPELALERASRSVNLCRADHGRTRAQRNAILATTCLQAGDVERCAAAGEQVLADGWNLRSWHVREDVAFLLAGIEATGSRAAASFVAQARDYLMRSGCRPDALVLSRHDDLEGFGEASSREGASSCDSRGMLA